VLTERAGFAYTCVSYPAVPIESSSRQPFLNINQAKLNKSVQGRRKMEDLRNIRLVLIALLAVGLSVPALAQQNVGGITGTVSDPTGAVIPGIPVTAQHQATGITRQGQTSGTGIYRFTVLQVGQYTVRVSTSGFKTFERPDIAVVSGETVTMEIQLEVGDITETVTVEALAPILDTTTETVGTTRTEGEIGRLPITLPGTSSRSAAGFARTVTGVNFDPAGGQDFMSISRAQINGGMAGTWGYQIDGVEAGMGEAESGSDFMSPIPEVIEEFRITANADASSGFNGGVAMEMTMKSGTNEFHGSVFWYNRNDFVGARNFFDQTGEPSVEKHNEGGFVVGGPIWKNKTFFFTSLDIYRFRQAPSSETGTVPTQLMRQGDFSEVLASEERQIYDPLSSAPLPGGGFTRTPFANNRLPSDRISSISTFLQQGYSLPNQAGLQNNWVGTSRPINVDKDQFTFKVDHHINESHRFTFAYEGTVPWFVGDFSGASGHSYIDAGQGYLQPELARGFIDDRDSERWRMAHLWTASPNVIVNFRFAATRNPLRKLRRFPFIGPPVGHGTDAGITGNLSGATPKVSIEGVSSYGPIFKELLVGSSKWPFVVTTSWYKGSHNFKFGGEFITLPLLSEQDFNSMGSWSFLDRITGLPGDAGTGEGYASYMLGELMSANVGTPANVRGLSSAWAFYVQDKWRVSSKFTLSLGIRWNIFIPYHERDDIISTFDPLLPNPGAGGNLGALSIYGQGAGRNGLSKISDTFYGAFSPHVGITYSLDPKTVIRTSFSLAFAPYWQKNYGSLGPTLPTDGFSATRTAASLDDGVTPAFNWQNGFPLSFPPLPVTDPTLANGGNLPFVPRDENSPAYSQNISFEIGRELPNQTSIRAAYVGNLSRRYPTSRGIGLNAIPLSEMSRGDLLLSDINSPEAQAAGIPLPYDGFVGSVAQALRPFPHYLGLTHWGAQIGNSSYHALQVNLQKRSGDVTFLVGYTFSKQLTNSNFPGFTGFGTVITQHPEIRRSAKSVLGKDRPQVLSMSWTYDLPFGSNKRFLNGAGKGLNQVVGGWRLSAIQNYMAGNPIRVTGPGSLPGTAGSEFATGIWPIRVPGVAIAGSSCGNFDPGRGDRYLNINAFATPGPFTLGNVSTLPSTRRCPLLLEAFQVEKFFPITERFRLHFGAMFDNLFNRVMFSRPNSNVGNPEAFGTITSAYPPRNIQFYLKFEF
jgi:hypothetical protein